MTIEVGRRVFIRTVTYHYVGTLISLVDGWATLRDASWVADSGPGFGGRLKTGIFEETEPFPNDVYINTDTIVDITEI